MSKRIMRLAAWAAVFTLLLGCAAPAMADTQSAVFTLRVRPRPTEAPEVTPAPEATATPEPTPVPELTYEDEGEDAQPAAPAEPAEATATPEPTPVPELTYEDDVEEEAPAEAADAVHTSEETSLRVAGDGLSDIILTVPAETGIVVLGAEGDWLKVEVDGVIGYIYKDSVSNWTPKEPEADADKPVADPIKVTIFSSRRTVVEPGETIRLTSKIEGAEQYETMLQWQCDKGNGFEDVPGANEDTYAFAASIESLSYSWRLVVYYR